MKKEISVKNIIVKSLGIFWIIDGLLQLQPKMFGAEFVSNILTPNLTGQPHFFSVILSAGIDLWNLNPALFNMLGALIQLAVGILLLFPSATKKFRIGLWVSIIWGLIIWIFGEGLGLLLTGSASFYTGAPGSVVFYVLLAVLLLMDEKMRSAWLPKIAGWTLILGAVLQTQPSFWSVNGVQGSIMASMMEQVHILASFPVYVANILSINPIIGNALLVFIPLIIGLLILFKPNRTLAVVTIIFLFLVWWLGQDFGMLTTLIAGTATDPNSAPVLALFVLPLFFRELYT